MLPLHSSSRRDEVDDVRLLQPGHRWRFLGGGGVRGLCARGAERRRSIFVVRSRAHYEHNHRDAGRESQCNDRDACSSKQEGYEPDYSNKRDPHPGFFGEGRRFLKSPGPC